MKKNIQATNDFAPLICHNKKARPTNYECDVIKKLFFNPFPLIVFVVVLQTNRELPCLWAPSTTVLSNLVAIRHMWRQDIWMWRQTVVQNWICNGKYTVYHSNYDKSGDSKTLVATIVANVATERMRLDTTDLQHSFSFTRQVCVCLFLAFLCHSDAAQDNFTTHIDVLGLRITYD
jgi:hypothetical protein